MVGLFYYGYSPFSLVAGVAIDRFGPRRVVPVGAALVGIGALLFSTGNLAAASAGRLLQGAGGVFALVGAIYIATQNFPPSRAATMTGATQMFGMAGGSAGQFLVGPAIGAGLPWDAFWAAMGVVGFAICALLYALLPKQKSAPRQDNWLRTAAKGLGTVFRNPQSILCGLIAGLLMVPTAIFDMIWGVRYLQPVIVASAAVLFACLAWILFGPVNVLPPYVLGIVTGIASGATMLLYTVIKEANPPELGGTATGVVNFLNFTLCALLGPVFAWALSSVSGGAAEMELGHYQKAFTPLLYGVGLAILLTLVTKETGPAVRPTPIGAQEGVRAR
jgi:MFS family permease